MGNKNNESDDEKPSETKVEDTTFARLSKFRKRLTMLVFDGRANDVFSEYRQRSTTTKIMFFCRRQVIECNEKRMRRR
jgi:hypothetical protein